LKGRLKALSLVLADVLSYAYQQHNHTHQSVDFALGSEFIATGHIMATNGLILIACVVAAKVKAAIVTMSYLVEVYCCCSSLLQLNPTIIADLVS
jgi:hypothetical protein